MKISNKQILIAKILVKFKVLRFDSRCFERQKFLEHCFLVSGAVSEPLFSNCGSSIKIVQNATSTDVLLNKITEISRMVGNRV
jgi:hypothetical protein